MGIRNYIFVWQFWIFQNDFIIWFTFENCVFFFFKIEQRGISHKFAKGGDKRFCNTYNKFPKFVELCLNIWVGRRREIRHRQKVVVWVVGTTKSKTRPPPFGDCCPPTTSWKKVYQIQLIIPLRIFFLFTKAALHTTLTNLETE